MGTIKTTGTGSALRIITKTVDSEVRVSCSCCEEGCCMYPAASAVAADLPAAITLLGVGSLTKSGSAYGDTTNGVILESGVWAKYVSGVRSTQACLITGDGNLTPGNDTVEDQFAATYDVGAGGYSGTLTRVSLCCWDGTTTDGSLTLPTRLAYTESILGFPPYWTLAIFRLPVVELPACPSVYGFFAADLKLDTSTPVGTYLGGWTVA